MEFFFQCGTLPMEEGMHIVAGLDVGTQSTKLICYDATHKKVVGKASSPHRLITGEGGTSEQEAIWYLDAVRSCFKQIDPSVKEKIAALGVSGQQHGFVPVGKNGEALAPVKLWNDTSTVAECETLTERLGGKDAVFKLINNEIMPAYTLAKILHLKNHRTEAYEQLAHLLLPHDWVNFYLTGEYFTEAGDASGTAYYSPEKRAWEPEMLRAVDEKKHLEHMLPTLIESHEIGGRLCKTAAEELGLRPGIVVSTGAGDNMASAIGTGCTSGGDLVMSMGTSGTLFGYSDTLVADRQGRLSAFCSSTGGYLPLLCTNNCTLSTEVIRNLFSRDVKTLDMLAGKAPIGSQGVTVLPFFTGERVPYLPYGKGVIAHLDSQNTTEENIARAALESAVFALRGGMDTFSELGFTPSRLILTGGGANSKIWRQIASDVFNLEVIVPSSTESAALGVALQALWALEGGSITEIANEHVLFDEDKMHQPDRMAVEQYAEAYKRYSTYVQALTPIFTRRI